MHKIGVLFDIDELDGGLYGYAAYKIFFAALDSRQIAGCTLSDGDTNATLAGRTRQYCIAVESLDAAKIAAVENALGKSSAKGLLLLSSRFLADALVRREPLVLAARINSAGKPVDCQTGWITEAWQDQHRGSGSAAMSSSTTSTGREADDKPLQKKRWWQFWK